MNIWAVNKDNTIKSLLIQLANFISDDQYKIICRPEDDLRSVRLAQTDNSNTELYIYSYGQQEDHYGVHIEFPNLIETNYSDTLEIHENLSFEQVLNLIVINLGVKLESAS